MARNNSFQTKYGNWALVTGASAGIGEEYARQIAAKGLNVVLVARRKQKLEGLAEELNRKHGVQTRIIAADLSTPDFMDAIIDGTSDIEIGLLVNNAGIYELSNLLEASLEFQLKMLELNTRAPLLLTHHFGKAMKARKRGGIIIVGSTVSGFGAPTNANYAATKSYDMILAEGLAAELKDSGVDVQAFLPGGTWTEGSHRMIAKPSMMIKSMMMETEPTVRASLNGLGKRTIVVPGLMNKTMYFMMSRFMPRSMAVSMFGMMMNMMNGGTKPSQKSASNPV